MDNSQFVIDFVACDALDRLIEGYEPKDVADYLYTQATQANQLISTYLSRMMYRLPHLDLKNSKKSEVFGQIMKMAEDHERSLIHAIEVFGAN